MSGDEFLSDVVARALRDDQHAVECATTWHAAERMLPHARPALVAIDAESEGATDRAVVDRVRAVTDVPLVVLSPSSPLDDRLGAMRAGADEIICKPFHLSELACRISVLLRRNGDRRATMELGDLVVDEGAHSVRRSGRHLDLTAIELTLLLAFCRNRGLVLSKGQLMTMVWGVDHRNVNLVEAHVSCLRRKLEAAGPRIIHTVRGAGYVLRPAETGNERTGWRGPSTDAMYDRTTTRQAEVAVA